MLAPWKESYDKSRQHIRKQRHYFANKGLSSQSNGFSSSHVWMWDLDYKESWVPKNWCFWTVVLETTFASPLDCTKIKPVHPRGNQSWIFIGRTDAEAEKPVIWPPDVKNWLTGEDPDAGKDWRQEEKGVTEDEMVVWHHWLDGHEFEQAVGVGDGPREARGAAVHGVAKSRTWLTNWNEWMIQGHRYLLFSGFSHHQLMWLQIECGTWITTLTSKGMRCFQTPGLHRARALPLTFHGLDLSSCESHCNQVVKLLGEECMKK